MSVRVVSAPWVLTGRPAPAPPPASGPSGARRPADAAPAPVPLTLREGAVALEGDHVLAVGGRRELEARFGAAAEPLDAVLLPALVNAHTHLELSHLRGRVPGGEGLASWIRLLVSARARDPEPGGALGDALLELEEAGVAALGEVTNTLASLRPVGEAGLSGTLFHEVFGFSDRRIEAALAMATELRARAGPPAAGLAVAPSPHAVYSTHPRVLARLLRAGPASIHLAEDRAEREFCARAAGPFAALVQMLGGVELTVLGRSAVAVAAPHLGPRTLVVHAVDLDDADRADLAASGATVVLCPRSNLHVSGVLPDLPRLLAAGVPLAVGTDSLASAPSLSPLAELATLARAYPEVPAARLLSLAWNGPAVGTPEVGRLAEGTAPGLIAAPLAGARPDDPAAWLTGPFAEAGRAFAWVARHRPGASA